MNRRRRTTAIAALGVALAGAAWSLYPRGQEETESALARRSSFDVQVEVVGSLDAAQYHNLVSSLKGDRGRIVSIVADGTVVRKGDVLARFDPSPLEADERRLGTEVQAREAQLEYARQALGLEQSQAEKSLANAEHEEAVAQAELARYTAYLDDLRALSRNVPVTGEIEQALRKLALARSGQQKARAGLERARREATHRIGQAMADERRAANDLASTRASLALAREEIGKATLIAPAGGFVVLHDTFTGEQRRKLRFGDTVWQGQPVMYIPDMGAIELRARVREEDLHKVAPGQEAQVQVEAYPELRLRARVSAVGALALEAASSTSAKHFQLTLSLEGNDQRLRPGMTARATILADSIRDAVAIPRTAVFFEGKQPICFVVGPGGISARAIALGRRGQDLVEVRSGLSENERVALARP